MKNGNPEDPIIIHVHNLGRVNINDLPYQEGLVESIGHSLSMQCRYTGHVKRFYSVAEHSVYVSRMLGYFYDKAGYQEKLKKIPLHTSRVNLGNALRMSGLAHDWGEAFVGDVSSPVKRKLPLVSDIEGYILQGLSAQYNFLEPSYWVHVFDSALGKLEMASDLLTHPIPMVEVDVHSNYKEEVEKTLEAFKETRFGLPQEEAKELFINEYKELCQQTQINPVLKREESQTKESLEFS